jgi:hypothetical protein
MSVDRGTGSRAGEAGAAQIVVRYRSAQDRHLISQIVN